MMHQSWTVRALSSLWAILDYLRNMEPTPEAAPRLAAMLDDWRCVSGSMRPTAELWRELCEFTGLIYPDLDIQPWLALHIPDGLDYLDGLEHFDLTRQATPIEVGAAYAHIEDDWTRKKVTDLWYQICGMAGHDERWQHVHN